MGRRWAWWTARAAFVAAVVVAAGIAGGSWATAGILGGLAALALVAGRRVGRYVRVHQGAGLVRDERGRAIADRAARNGFVVVVFAVATLSLVLHALGRTALAVGWLDGVVAAGVLVWVASDVLQRRR